MSTPDWPLTLPQALEVGAQDTRQAGFVRAPTDTGPAKQRKRFTSTVRFLQGTMLLNSAERAIFESFYSQTINEGADIFTFPDPLDFTSQNARFRETPSLVGVVGTPGGAIWRATLNLEIIR